MKKWLVLLFLSGCAVGPNYKAPSNASIEEHWHKEVGEEMPLTAWWQQFKDPLLDQFIAETMSCNYTLQIAEANILQARALKKIAAADFYPKFSADGFGGRISTAGNNKLFPNLLTNLFALFFDASWEIDLFGKTRRSVEGAKARIASNIESKRDLMVSLLAETARNYIEIRSAQKTKAFVEETIKILQDKRALIKQRFDYGLDSLLELEQVEAELTNAQAALPPQEALIKGSIYSLSVLTGKSPETLLSTLLVPRLLPPIPLSISIGLRSDLLRRRPDVRMAERSLAAATADVGVAIASLFPSFSLFGAIGLDASHLHQLFDGQSKLWLTAASLSAPVFQGGKLRAGVAQKRAALDGSLAQYHQTVLVALQDAETTLCNFFESVSTEQFNQQSVISLERLYQLSQQRYCQGLVPKLDLLNAQQQLLSSQQTLVSGQTNALLSLIALYKALGGGWEAFESPEFKL